MTVLYTGPGTSQESIAHMQRIIPCTLLQPDILKQGNWLKSAKLFIMPGGADIPYTQHLNGLGNELIRSFVENGGTYLGICAGSYYAAKEIEFAKGKAIEVIGPRELGFYPGLVRGPILADYDYHSDRGALIAPIRWITSDDIVNVYYNGGGYFVDAEKYENVKVLAVYEGNELPAIVECRVGRGKAILSGVHFETQVETVDLINDFKLRF